MYYKIIVIFFLSPEPISITSASFLLSKFGRNSWATVTLKNYSWNYVYSGTWYLHKSQMGFEGLIQTIVRVQFTRFTLLNGLFKIRASMAESIGVESMALNMHTFRFHMFEFYYYKRATVLLFQTRFSNNRKRLIMKGKKILWKPYQSIQAPRHICTFDRDSQPYKLDMINEHISTFLWQWYGQQMQVYLQCICSTWIHVHVTASRLQTKTFLHSL